VPIDAWRSYFRWHVLSGDADALPQAFRDEQFAFWGANIGHQEEPTPRWKRCVELTDSAFGEAFAQNWVERNFPDTVKAGAQRLVDALERALAEEIRGLPWMNATTKQAAQRKVAAIQNNIGHPQQWRDYTGLQVDPRDFPGNLRRSALFEREHRLGKWGKPFSVDEWDVTPTVPMVRYARALNSLYVPAAIVQPPFFDRNADPAVNFGGIGVLTARELTHGFDELGSKFDERGRVRDWQTADGRKEFAGATSCEVDQNNEFKPKSDDPVDPAQLGETGSLAIADTTAENGGLRIAFRALMDALVAEGKSGGGLDDGYTESQRFFLSFAQLSCENQTFLSARAAMSADPHSVGRLRVNGAVRNFEEFGRAFQCQKGQPMYPEKSCKVW
jgi:putative endopeptidase